ncbi:hypothetical protein [Comamonas suwonensis]|uniref:hypothetical protein n=1 Tax=Comamonas suwonensis TaxID=2606214 RepID=UPI00145D7294|nr:hypothetical protein [Comamonas suwonensis]MBI1624312.1 hypothetical protein [Comamonas suwonensis]
MRSFPGCTAAPVTTPVICRGILADGPDHLLVLERSFTATTATQVYSAGLRLKSGSSICATADRIESP